MLRNGHVRFGGRAAETTSRKTGTALLPDPYTYVATWSGMAFTAFVSDVFSRRIVGWRTTCSMPTALPLDALEMALWTRDRAGHTDPDGRLEGLIHHSDAGSQYTAIRYAERLADAGALASIGSVGDSFDNAMAESVIGLYKTECVRHDGPFRSVDDLELATLSWVTGSTPTGCTALFTTSPQSNTRPSTTVRSTPDSCRCRENPPSTEPGAVQAAGPPTSANQQ
jgi:transposase InsO family protein